jgi:hypothetical protein
MYLQLHTLIREVIVSLLFPDQFQTLLMSDEPELIEPRFSISISGITIPA